MTTRLLNRSGADLALLLVCTVLCYFSLYGPQPLLPVFEQEFGISLQAAAALITVSFAFLASAPLLYGVLLSAWPARRVLQGALLVLALSCLGFAFAQGYNGLLAARIVQSAALPAAIISLMTLVATLGSQRQIQTVMSIYIAATIAGGYFGRLGAGAVAQFLDWRVFFFAVGIGLLGLMAALRRLPAGEAAQPGEKPTPRLIASVLADPQNRIIYAAIFCVFFTFTSIFSFLPFRLAELTGQASPLQAGYMYSGYLIGIVMALAARRVSDLVGGTRRAAIIASVIYIAGTASLGATNTTLLFALMFVFCAPMFLIHTLAIGHLNERATHLRGLTNGLYVASYYWGGILGSYLPGSLYQSMGWNALVGLACFSAVAAGGFIWFIDWRG